MPTASTATAVNMAVQRRFAARVHQRRIAVTLAVERAADRLAARYRRLAAEAAEAAARGGIIGLDQLRRALEAEFAAAADEAAALLADAARQGFDAAARAVFDALPDPMRTLLASIAAAAVREAHNDPAAPGRWAIDSELPAGPVSDAQAAAAVRRMLFAPPSEKTVAGWLTAAIPGGLSWDQRLRRWTEPARKAMLNELTAGLAAGENVEQLRGRVQPFADNVAYKAMRIARTEGCRAAERAGRDCYERLGPMLDGMQIVAVFDEWTRPHHAARNGRIYRRGDDGAYRDERGELLPDLPDEPNCRCMTIPVLGMPEALRGNRTAQRDWRTATGKLIPDPASYLDWFAAAPRPQRVRAVGAERYQAVRDLLAAGSDPREPEWPDFIDAEGRLLPVDRLRGESPTERDRRRAEVDLALAQRRALFRAVAASNLPTPLIRRDPANVFFAGGDAVERQIRTIAARYAARLQPSAEEQERRRAFDIRARAHVLPSAEVRGELVRRDDQMRSAAAEADLPRPPTDYPPHYQRLLEASLIRARHEAVVAAAAADRGCLALPKNERTALRTLTKDLPEEAQRPLREAAEFVGAITRRGRLPDTAEGVFVTRDGALSRGAMEYRKRGRQIAVGPPPLSADKFVHELGHHLQHHVGGLHAAALRWRDQASRGGGLRIGIGFDSRESPWYYRERTDGRRWLDPYMGRVYFQGEPQFLFLNRLPPEDEDRMEVVASVCQLLWKNPANVARNDPELFDLVVGRLRGEEP